MNAVSLYPLCGLPEITEGCNLSLMLMPVLSALPAEPGDILIITHKIVSKAAGLVRPLGEIIPSKEAVALADSAGKDPRVAEVILECSDTVHSCDRGILIAQRRDGWICCNAGVDASNTGASDTVVLLPEDCDVRAEQFSRAFSEHLGFPLPVIICDTHGRALRSGTVGVAVGSFGLIPIRRYKGEADRNGRPLQSTQEAVADEIAGAATLLMGQGSEGIPAVILRGFYHTYTETDSRELRLPKENQLYRIQGTAFSRETN